MYLDAVIFQNIILLKIFTKYLFSYFKVQKRASKTTKK